MIANKFGFPSPKIGTTQRRSAWPQIQRRHARIEKRATSLINAMLVYRKEVATVSQPPFPTVPPAGLPTASTVGAKAAVYVNVDKRVVSGGAGADGGYMGGATGHAHVAFCLAPRHPPVTPTNQHQARGGERGRTRERERARERERERNEGERASTRGCVATRLREREVGQQRNTVRTGGEGGPS